MDWERLIKRYVWDDQKTPYLVPVPRLTRHQADNELLIFTVFMSMLFAAIGVLSLNETLPYGKSYGISAFSLSIAGCAVLFGLTKHVFAACYFIVAPLGVLGYLLFWGWPPGTASIDKVFMVIVALVLLRYVLRVVSIAKAYPNLPEPAGDG
ncbi:MAG: hypothetical protein RIM84_18030 [Alphaproteobacteria bacterium]